MNSALTLATILVLVVGFSMVVWELRRIARAEERSERGIEELRRFSMNPRTRMAQAGYRDGPVTQEQSDRRLGRASAARRVVVGGDPDSTLFETLNNANTMNPAMVDDE